MITGRKIANGSSRQARGVRAEDAIDRRAPGDGHPKRVWDHDRQPGRAALARRQVGAFEAEPQTDRDEPISHQPDGRGRNAAGWKSAASRSTRTTATVTGTIQSRLRQVGRGETISAGTAAAVISGPPCEVAVFVDAASNTAVRMPSRPSMRFRPRLAASCDKVRPHHHAEIRRRRRPRARSCAIQALAASVSSCHASVRKPADSIASRVAAAVIRKLVAGVRAQGTG